MYARMVTGSFAPGKLDEAVKLWRDAVAPAAKRQPEFIRAYLLVQRQTGKLTSVGLWQSEAAVQQSANWNQEQIARFSGLFSKPPTVEQYDVAAEA
jgi:hypothetical protein